MNERATPRILITGRSIAPSAIAFLDAEHCVYQFAGDAYNPASLEAKVRDFRPDGLVVRKGRIDDRILGASKTLRVICKHGVGVDNIDVDAASRLHIPVMITASANYNSVAEHTLALLLGLLRAIPAQAQYTRRGGWDKAGYGGEDLLGKTVGVLGLGRIARRFCELLSPFGTGIFAYDPYLAEDASPSGVHRVKTLEEMLPSLDILSIHCPLTPQTAGMVGHRVFSVMRPGGWIVNTARGKIIDEPALIQALSSGRLRGAALDTLAEEPPAQDHPLLAMENVIVTNHVAGSSVTALEAMSLSSVRLVVNALRGIFPDCSHFANPDVLHRPPSGGSR
jgi:D-3-phosphoglycerate dehydrogenase